MIRFLRGTVFRVESAYAEVEVGGVGYQVWLTERHALTLEVGTQTFVYTHHHIREDAQVLYGFESEENREWFELMLNVSGIGPKGAIQVISSATFDAFYTSVLDEDLTFLCSLPGIGKKTAGRLIVELKDKLKDYVPVASTKAAPSQRRMAKPVASVQDEVLEALKLLGYPERQVFDVVRDIFAERGELSVEQGLKLSLQQLDRSRAMGVGNR